MTLRWAEAELLKCAMSKMPGAGRWSKSISTESRISTPFSPVPLGLCLPRGEQNMARGRNFFIFSALEKRQTGLDDIK